MTSRWVHHPPYTQRTQTEIDLSGRRPVVELAVEHETVANGAQQMDARMETWQVDNVLLHWVPGAQRPILKLCDFSFSREQSDTEPFETTCGTPEYMAPEASSPLQCAPSCTSETVTQPDLLFEEQSSSCAVLKGIGGPFPSFVGMPTFPATWAMCPRGR